MRQTTSDIARRSVSRRTFMVHAAGAAAALTLPAGALAQAPWPSRTITLVVPFPPGGQADLAARPVAAALAKTLGQSVVVENKSGAGGALGAAAVAKAEPDGHTLLLTLNSLVISPPAERLYDRTPLYEVNQFVPIARVLSDPNILVVKATSPWKTIGEFVEDAKRRPGEITFSSSGNYGAAHVSVELFAQAAGIKLLHVPYRGAGPAITGLLGDQVALTSTTAGTLAAQQEAGLVRFLATMSSERLPRFPSVPTLRESGYPAQFHVWAGLLAPKGTPAAVVERLRTEMRAALQNPDVTGVFDKAGTAGAYLDAPAFADLIADDSKTIASAVKAIGKLDAK
jgi:tripartite-type tricarboxylate transporter receptor subunit TctC